MKSRSREINVFSMSALDLFASALGAFILISMVLMPYFLRVSHDEVAELRRDLAQAQSALQQCQQREAACRQELDGLRQEVDRLRADLEVQGELRQCQADLDACEEKLSKTFLAVVIKWSRSSGLHSDLPGHDIDLHIIDAAGREFYFRDKTIPGRPGELSEDTTRAPGVEIWEVPEAPPGEYRVLYNLYDYGQDPEVAIVEGGMYYRDGSFRFRDRRLTRTGRANALLVAVVTVGNDGGVEIEER